MVVKNIRQTAQWKRVVSVTHRMSNGICYLCNYPVDRNMKGDFSPHVDHIYPLSRGGAPFDQDNLAVVHRICNLIKGSRTVEEIMRDELPYKAVTSLLEIETTGINWFEDNSNDEEVDKDEQKE